MHIRQHEGDPCRYCGAVNAGPESTCIPRVGVAVSELRPEPARRILAAEDIDAISARIEQLADERKAALNYTEDTECQT